MKVAIQMSEEEELKALPILLRHSPGMILHNGTYLVGADAARALRRKGVQFTELGREAVVPHLEGVRSCERI
jgi:hypothetical protein